MTQPEVYISHAWGGESDVILKKIVKALEKQQIEVVYDHKDLQYRGSINAFMQELGKARAVILIISNKYLQSEYCMFELLQIYDNQQFLHRIFPVVLDEVQISKSTDRLDLIKFWEEQQHLLESKIRELKSLAHIQGITDDLNLYGDIRKHIAKFTHILKDINTLNISTHYEENFNSLVRQVQQALVEREEPEMTPLEWREKIERKVPWKTFGGIAFLLSFGMVIFFIFFYKPDVLVSGGANLFLPWEGKWVQQVESEEDQFIKGEIELSYVGNSLRGKVINKYPDRRSASTSNTLYDISIDDAGKILKGKWSSDDFPNFKGTFEWHLDGDQFTGYYTVDGQQGTFTWNGEK